MLPCKHLLICLSNNNFQFIEHFKLYLILKQTTKKTLNKVKNCNTKKISSLYFKKSSRFFMFSSIEISPLR